ncbi:MAG: helix-turn-helix domain-containing protein [Burkholderiaceae bacterium]|nr:helix-turn-helix domain-containing protein [Burkholderiaceae bacterium]
MSEDDVHGEPAGAPADGKADMPPSFGARLAAAREAAGLSVGEIAGRLRLHPKQVRALESADLGQLPEAAYVRGFVRSYARAVDLDPAPLVDDLNSRLAPAAGSVVDGMASTQDYSPVQAASREQVSRRVVLGLALLALVALGAIGWYATREPSPRAPAAAAAAPTSPVAPAAPAATPAAEPAADRAAPQAADAAAAPATESPRADAPPAEAAAPAPAPAGPPALLAISFSGVSWVEITDANGRILVSQLAHAGEVLRPAGALPFAVVIGDASKATVVVRGEPLGLEPVTRGNVARFSIK